MITSALGMVALPAGFLEGYNSRAYGGADKNTGNCLKRFNGRSYPYGNTDGYAAGVISDFS